MLEIWTLFINKTYYIFELLSFTCHTGKATGEKFLLLQSWDVFFRNSTAGAGPGQAYQAPPSLGILGRNETALSSMAGFMGGNALGGQVDEKIIDDHLAVQAIIRSYQVYFWYKRDSFQDGPCSTR
jgi:hypothetical protein